MEVPSHVGVLVGKLKCPIPHVPMGSVDHVLELVLVDSGEFTEPLETVGLVSDFLRKSLETFHV